MGLFFVIYCEQEAKEKISPSVYPNEEAEEKIRSTAKSG